MKDSGSSPDSFIDDVLSEFTEEFYEHKVETFLAMNSDCLTSI